MGLDLLILPLELNKLLFQWGIFHGTRMGTDGQVLTPNFPITYNTIYAVISQLGVNESNSMAGHRFPYEVTTSYFKYRNRKAMGYASWVSIGTI